MDKDMRIESLKERFLSIVESQVNGNIANVDAKELGEVVDCAKDCAEICKLCYEAEYYKSIVEAMKKTDDPEHYMKKYLPNMEDAKYYTSMRNYPMDDKHYPMYANMRNMDMDQGKMYYTEPNMYASRYYDVGGNGGNAGNSAGNGRSYISRRGYMEAKNNHMDEETKTKEMEKYITDLSYDIADMVNNMKEPDKQMLKQKLISISNTIK